MRILFVSSVSDVAGGAELSLLELARALRDRGHTVSLAAWGHGDLTAAFGELGGVAVLGARDPASPLGGATRRLPFLRPVVDLLNRLRLWFRPSGGEARWLGSVIAKTRPDVVHTNCDLSTPPTAAAAEAAGVPWVAHVRDQLRAWFQPRVAAALRSADTVIAASDFLAGRFREHGIDPVVIPNPVAGNELGRSIQPDERARLRTQLMEAGVGAGADSPDPGEAPFVVAVVGRLDEQKGTLRVVEAAKRLAEPGGTEVRFLLAGRGSASFEARVRREIVDAGVETRVLLLGHRPDVARWLPAVDALAVPSTEEAFGRMIVEALLAGLPVVAADDGAAPEIIEHDRTGILVSAGDPAALAAALRTLAADPATARRLGEAGRAAAERYEPDLIAAQVEAIYNRLREG